MLSSYCVGKKQVDINLLQYADDTIFWEESSLLNMVVIKSMMRCLELVSRLKLNFNKSCFGVLGAERSESIKFAKLLNCILVSLLFIYLGMPIGVNPRRKKTWNPVIAKFKNKLAPC